MTNANDLIHSFNHIENCEGNLKGLTKREYFAAIALQGILANSVITDSVAQLIDKGDHQIEFGKKLFAIAAVQTADELINELNS